MPEGGGFAWKTTGSRCSLGGNICSYQSTARMSHDPKSESSPSIDVEIGSVLAGKYRVDRVLGVGGMGVVVAATHLELDTLVALKFLLPEVRDNSEVVGYAGLIIT